MGDTERIFLKEAKRIREIMKLQVRAGIGEKLELKQAEKVARLGALIEEFQVLEQALHHESSIRAKCEDVLKFIASRSAYGHGAMENSGGQARNSDKAIEDAEALSLTREGEPEEEPEVHARRFRPRGGQSGWRRHNVSSTTGP